MKLRISFGIIILSSMAFCQNVFGATWYVTTTGGTVTKDGTSWATAYQGLQAALTTAVSGDEIWVAYGIYHPTSAYTLTNTSRYYHFEMKNGVTIYGGLAGTETLISERANYGLGEIHETILSGDIGTIGDNSDNCFHVFYHDGLGLDGTAKLDGFTVTGGHVGGEYPHNCGGGISNRASSPTITNCTFTLNSASSGGNGFGGGLFNWGGVPTITNCVFTSNYGDHGGGIYNENSSPVITNCTFKSNSAYHGGGMNNTHASPTITNCAFIANMVTFYGGGIYFDNNSSSSLTNCTITLNSSDCGGGIYSRISDFLSLNNCIIWGNIANDGRQFFINGGGPTMLNYCCYANEPGDNSVFADFSPDVNSIASNPLFVGSIANPNHPYSIPGNSPCVDAGNDSYNSQLYDIRGTGYSRKLNKMSVSTGIIDMGAYEYKLGIDPLPIELTSFTASAEKKVVTLQWNTATEVNNFGFDIERKSTGSWSKIGFIKGQGTTNAAQSYSFVDKSVSGKVVYRLKQIDRDGEYEYSKEVEVTIDAIPTVFTLAQNYPNPFNPTTVINYSIASASHVALRVYDLLGRVVAELVNGQMESGNYTVIFSGSHLSSGVYFYRLDAGVFSDVKRLTVMK